MQPPTAPAAAQTNRGEEKTFYLAVFGISGALPAPNNLLRLLCPFCGLSYVFSVGA